MMHNLNAHAKSAKIVIFASFAPLREIFAPQHVIDPDRILQKSCISDEE